AIGPSDLRHWLAGGEVDDGVHLQAFIRLAPAQNRQLDHQYTPTVVVAAKPRYGRTPLTPSHGYCSQGGSRSPSSRSRNPGMKSSFVSVVSLTRPVSPYSTILSGLSKSTTSITARGCGG